jgi:uncharacterized protein (TIGR02453 family)
MTSNADAAPVFAGFPARGLTFLRDLARNNEREWFNARKSTYVDDVDVPLRALLFDVAKRCARAKIPLAPNPRQPTFRVYRDVRFAKDKSPYKTHAGACLYRNGDKTSSGMLYVHIDPKDSFAAVAFYRPDAPVLGALRRAMASGNGFTKCLAELKKRGCELDMTDSLTRLPRDFSGHAGTALEPYLKLTSLVISRKIDKSALRDPGLAEEVFGLARDAKALLTWGWAALEA